MDEVCRKNGAAMKILIPMGGKSSRFFDKGYKVNKVLLDITSRYNGKTYPMVLSALKDIPWIKSKGNELVCINSLEHSKNGLEKKILKEFPHAVFIHDHVKLDQAFGCFLARSHLDTDEDLFIGACDNGFEVDLKDFNDLKKKNDLIVFTHTNDENIERDPFAHSWLSLKGGTRSVKALSFKKPISKNPTNDHATTGMFWFRNSNVFLKSLESMIWKKESVSKKYYIDELVNHYIKKNLRVSIIDVKYFCWGTPVDYEIYESSIKYWIQFSKQRSKYLK